MLRIEASPRYRTVGSGETVTYTLVSTDAAEALLPGDTDSIIWSAWEGADIHTAKEFKRQRKGFQFTVTFERPGRFVVLGGILLPASDRRFAPFLVGRAAVAEYPQNVQPTDSFMWDPVNGKRTHVQDPTSGLVGLYRYWQVLGLVAAPLALRLDSPGLALKAKHEAYAKTIETSVFALSDRLQSTQGWVRIPVDAYHRDDSTNRISELKVFLAHPEGQRGLKTWKLVDWTHPGDKVLDGEYTGKAPNNPDAALDAIEAFKNGNQYPKGVVGLTVPANIIGAGVYQVSFISTGRSFLGTVADFLTSAAMITGLLALVLTVVPLGVTQAAAAVLWLGLVSGALGAGAAKLNIYDRDKRGVSDFAQDAIDGLTIVGCLFAGGAAWARCATVTLGLGGAVRQFVMIGNATMEGFQGVFIGMEAVIDGQEAATALIQLQQDPNISPREKIERFLKHIGKLAATGAMIYSHARLRGVEMSRMNNAPPPGPKRPPPPGPHGEAPSGSPADNLKKLKDPKSRIDFTGVPKQTGHTKDGSHTTTVQNAPGRPIAPALPPPPPPQGRQRTLRDILGPEKYDALRTKVQALRSSRPDLQSLTDDEMIAIRAYSGDHWAVMNQALRSKDAVQMAGARPLNDPAINGLRKLPAFSGRASRSEARAIDEAMTQYRKGSNITMDGFTSSTTGQAPAQREGNIAVTINAKGINGHDITGITVHEEKEILFSPGARFLVRESIRIQDSLLVILDEI